MAGGLAYSPVRPHHARVGGFCSTQARREVSPLVQTRPVTEVVADAVTAQAGQPGPLLAVLHEIVSELGYVPVEAVGPIAAQLNLSRAEVHGVISFYSDLRTTPPGRWGTRRRSFTPPLGCWRRWRMWWTP